MNEPRLELLTKLEREALRLSLTFKSKQIGPMIGRSEHTVDGRIKAAMKKLGTGDRREAALILLRAEDPEAYQRLVNQSPGVSLPPISISMGPSDSDAADASAPAAEPLPSAQPARSVLPGWLLIFLGLKDGEPRDLRTTSRLILILLVALGAIAAIGSFVSGLEALTRITAPNAGPTR